MSPHGNSSAPGFFCCGCCCCSFFSFFFFLRGKVSYCTSFWTLVEEVNTLVTDWDLSAMTPCCSLPPIRPSFLVLLLSCGSWGSFLLGAPGPLRTGVTRVPADMRFS